MKLNKIIIIIFIILCCILLIIFNKSNRKFSLNDAYYKTSEFKELSIDKYNEIIKKKESFAIFIYQPLCTTSYEFNKVLTSFAQKYQISFYKMSFTSMKETKMKESIKYYPSLIIYHEGKLVDYLDANSENDKNYYKKLDDFEKWFSKYVKLPKAVNNETASIEENIDSDMKIDANLKNIKYDENKVNIYFFWGDGCPHCEDEFKFINSLETEYGDYFTLNTFEVWHNEDNEKLLKQFAPAMGDEITGVPYTIIGNKTFKGWGKKFEKDFLNTIKEQHKNSYDVYFDKGKK